MELNAHNPTVLTHVDSKVALMKLIQTNRLFFGGPGSHSKTQARRAAAIGDCYVAKCF